MLDEEVGQPEEGVIVSSPSFLGGFVNPPQREEPLNQVSGAPGLAADAQVGFVIEGLMLQVQPELAIGLALRVGDRLLFVGQRRTNPLRDRLPFQWRRVSHELLRRAFSESMAVIGMQVTPIDGQQHRDALLTRNPISLLVSQIAPQRFNTLPDEFLQSLFFVIVIVYGFL